MNKPGDESNGEARGESAAGQSRKPGQTLPLFRLSPARVLFISTVLIVLSFLSHIFFLLLVDPWKYLAISKESAMTYSGIPLCFGVAFLLAAIFSFLRIESRSPSHIILIIIVFVFGSLTLQGLSGIALHLVRGPHGM
jgi:hypothetical protein